MPQAACPAVVTLDATLARNIPPWRDEFSGISQELIPRVVFSKIERRLLMLIFLFKRIARRTTPQSSQRIAAIADGRLYIRSRQ